MSKPVGRLFDSYGNELPASVRWADDFEGNAFAFVDAPELRPAAIAFRMKQYAERDRLRASELLGDRIARRAREDRHLWRMQLWPAGGPYPTVNVDATTRIYYPPSFQGMFAVTSTVAEPNAATPSL